MPKPCSQLAMVWSLLTSSTTYTYSKAKHGKKVFLIKSKIYYFRLEIDRAEAIMLHGDGNTLVVGLNNHLEFWLIRHGSFNFLKKVKIIGNDEQKATIVDLASNIKSKGQCIVSIDSNSVIRATSLKVSFFKFYFSKIDQK